LAEEPNFEELVREHQAMVFRVLLRLTGNRENVDDLAQEVFLRFYRAWAKFRGEAQVSTYLYRIAVNVAKDEWKRRKQSEGLVSISDETSGWEERLAHPGRNAEELMEEREFQDVVEAQLQRLSGVERAVLVLYHQEQRTYEQIALALHLPIGTVRTHLHRGRKKLREGIEAAQSGPHLMEVREQHA